MKTNLKMKKSLALIAFLLLSTISIAQNGPKIEFSSKNNTIDYGTVKVTENATREFSFTNTGNAPLVVSNVLSTSGFTIANYTETPVLPGKSGTITIKYNMAIGPIRKTITVETNAINHENGRIAVKVKGEVIEN